MKPIPFFGSRGVLQILNVLGSREESTFTKIIDELGISRKTLRLTLEELVEQGFVEKRVHGRRSYYSITEKGRGLGALNQIQDLRGYLDRIVGDEAITKKLMEGIEHITATSSGSEVARWYKSAMERLDALADERTRALVMEHCGYSCALGNRSHIEAGVATRKKYKSIDEFLEAEARALSIVREGDVIHQTYRPHATHKVRCYCSLIRSLPADETISLTYCNCSKGFVKKFWEAVLEKPVKVELIRSVMSGAPECKFAIYL